MNSETLLLMQLYWRLDRRADGGIGRLGWLRRVVVAAALIFFAGLLGVSVGGLVVEGMLGPDGVKAVVGLLLALVFLGTAFAGFNQALQGLYLSDDLEKLFVAPIPSRSIVTAKLLGRLPTVMFFMLAGALPALVSFGFVVGMGPAYYLLGTVLLLVAPLFGISVGTLIAIFLVRLLPARRLSEWVGAASILIGTIFSLLFYLPRMLNGGNQQFTPETEAALAEVVSTYGELPLPTNLAGNALVDLGQGRMATALDWGGLLAYFLLTVGLFLFTLFVADRLYLSGWLRMQSSGARATGFEDEAGIFGGDSLDLILGYKDWLLRVRDARLFATMFSGVVFAVLMLFFIFRPQQNGGSILSIADDFNDAGFLAALFSKGVILSGAIYIAGWSIFSRIAQSALSLERESVYILRTAPISPTRILRAKVLGVLIPYMLLVTLLLLLSVIVFDISLLWTPYSWLVLFVMGAGMLTYVVSLDFLFPKLDWDDPRRMTNRKAGWRSMLGVFLYSVIAMLIAVVAFVVAVSVPGAAIPAVIFGLGLLAGGTWFFVAWRMGRIEAAWPFLGAEP